MAISFEQVGPTFAARVTGVDATRPLSPGAVAAIEEGMDRYAVLMFPDQRLTDECVFR